MHGVICKWFITPNTRHKPSVPDLDLQTLNDHGIYTIDETKELLTTVKLQLSALYLNTKSLLNQHFKQINSLLDSISIIECSETWDWFWYFPNSRWSHIFNRRWRCFIYQIEDITCLRVYTNFRLFNSISHEWLHWMPIFRHRKKPGISSVSINQ